MAFIVVGNIVAQRMQDGSLKKIPIINYDQHNYTNLIRFADQLNQPHLDRLYDLFSWIDNDQTEPNKLANELDVKKKLPPTDPLQLKNHIKKQYLSAYNEYFDVNYSPTDVNLKD